MYTIEIRGKDGVWKEFIRTNHPYWGYLFRYPVVILKAFWKKAEFDSRNYQHYGEKPSRARMVLLKAIKRFRCG